VTILSVTAVSRSPLPLPYWHSLCALLLLVCLPSLATAACEKTLRWNDDPPFSMQADDGSIVGIDVDINRAVLERLGCQATLRKLP
jgi:polar amino acid transport system substrate-binding protein